MDGYRSPPLRRRRWTLALTLLAFALALAIGGLLWQSVETSSVLVIQESVKALKPVFTAMRLSVIAVIALTWSPLVSAVCGWQECDEPRRAALLALRWRIILWLIVIELVLGQNLLGHFLDTFRSPVA